MPPATQINGHAEATRVLDEGRLRLCQETGLESPKRRDVIWFLFQDAMRTERALPDKERSWLHSGDRSQWPEIYRSAQERFEVEREQLTDGIRVIAPPMGFTRHIDPGAVGRMLEVLDWLKYIRAGNPKAPDVAMTRNNRELFKALASGIRPRNLRWVVKDRGQSRNMINSIKIRCLRQIETGLEADKVV